jgi:serine/threonine-protein kinase RsbT
MDSISAGEAPLRSQHDIVMARQLVRRLSQEVGFSLVDQTKIVTAASELARNTLIYGNGGLMKWQLLSDSQKKGVKLVFSDEGPGIANIELALTDGWTSGGGLGLGLSGARRLVNEFDIESSSNGTRVTVIRWG